ncbi:zonadhesin-like [Chironomus tepperi]|uniref:zonadhesin-like n=1 Tax=Chironomus tepperi TaxID=113505 RepID=UPI00391F7326
MKIIFSALIFVAVAAHADARKRCFPLPTPVVDPPPFPACGKNEQYSECGANGCQSTCANPTLNQVCRATCIAGCICNEGYLRDENNNCVKAEECPNSQCKKFEIFSDCAPEACKKTCDLLDTACRAPCVPGCKCPEGQVYLDDNRDACVVPEECPRIIVDPPPPEPVCAKKYESYTDCGTACPLTCENLNNPPQICTANCVVGCACDEGYVRNFNGDCVHASDCPVMIVDPPIKEPVDPVAIPDPFFPEEPVPEPEPKPEPKCGQHESYTDCGDSPCQATCENPNLPMMCKAACRPGCGCDEGYVRDADRNCVKLKECPQTLKCEEHEVYEACSTLCGEPSCDRSEALYCGLGCQPRCLCEEGYVRNAEHKCIKVDHCPKRCKKFEIFSDCAPEACKKTCDTLNTACRAPCVPGCKCPEGQVYLDDNRDACVAPEECPQIIVDPVEPEPEPEFVPEPVPDPAPKHKPEPVADPAPKRKPEPIPEPAEEPVELPLLITSEKMKLLFVALIFIAVAERTQAKKKCFPLPTCGQHEVYSACGADCQSTCADPNLSNLCTAPCKAGCVCEAKYVRAPNGKCVLLNECPQLFECGENEVYEACSTSCGDPTCANRNSFFCGGGCKPKCVCKQSYVRNAENKCIDAINCDDIVYSE